MLRVVITGGIGSGKTAVTDHLRDLGFTVIDSDVIAHRITAPGGSAIPYIREKFGDAMIAPDGSLDRDRMRELVYSDPEQKKILEQGTTEVIIKDIDKMLDDCEAAGERAAFAAAPLYFESGCHGNYDVSWLVTAEDDVRVRRVCKRDGLDEEQVRKIIDTQMPESEKRPLADIVTDNSGTKEELLEHVDGELRKLGLLP